MKSAFPEVSDVVSESPLPESKGLCPDGHTTRTSCQLKAEIKNKLRLERPVVVIVLTFRTEQPGTSSACFKVDMKRSEAERGEGRGGAQRTETEEQVTEGRDRDDETERVPAHRRCWPAVHCASGSTPMARWRLLITLGCG